MPAAAAPGGRYLAELLILPLGDLLPHEHHQAVYQEHADHGSHNQSSIHETWYTPRETMRVVAQAGA